MKPLRLKRLKKKRLRKDPAKVEEEIAQNEYNWVDQQNMRGGPSNPQAIPFDQKISVFPDLTLTWIKSHCKFSSKS